MPSDDSFDLADTFAEVARLLAAEPDKQATLDEICRLLVATVDACEHAGVTLVEDRRAHSLASSDELPRSVDAIQDEVEQGPCYSAIEDAAIIVSADLASEERWEQFAPRASEECGVRSVLSVPLQPSGKPVGALNLYSKTVRAFDEDDRHVASIFSAHASVALAALRKEEQFDDALLSRDVIGRAKGILQAKSGLSDDEAFDMLRRASQRMNVKLRDLAQQIAHKYETDQQPRAD